MMLLRPGRPAAYAFEAEHRLARAVHEAEPPVAPKPRLLDRVRAALRARHYSRRTEEAYVASTQNQALSALLFLYREVLELEVPWLDGLVRARRPERLPVVLTRDEVRAVIQRLVGGPRLMAYLLYGAGLRLLECCRLRAVYLDENQ